MGDQELGFGRKGLWGKGGKDRHTPLFAGKLKWDPGGDEEANTRIKPASRFTKIQ
jgi:hypothetical protein